MGDFHGKGHFPHMPNNALFKNTVYEVMGQNKNGDLKGQKVKKETSRLKAVYIIKSDNKLQI